MNQSDLIRQLQEELRRLKARFTVPIVCLCGSTRFMDAFFEAGWKFTLDGWIVLSVGVCKHGPPDHAGESLGPDVCKRLDELHKRKIDLCDFIYVLNVDGYIGPSTQSEIDYAESLGKSIMYFMSGFTDKGKEITREDHHRIESPGLNEMEDKDYESGNGDGPT